MVSAGVPGPAVLPLTSRCFLDNNSAGFYSSCSREVEAVEQLPSR